jgi:predicted anti-sigma-YlaC factor YlaD
MIPCDADMKELLADVAAGRAGPTARARVAEHRAACPDCDAEASLLELLALGRPRLSDERAERIERGVREGRAGEVRRRVPGWALATAAVAVVALGTPALVQRMSTRTVAGDPAAPTVGELVPMWMTDEPLVAGAPVLDALSDDELVRLLEEMEG